LPLDKVRWFTEESIRKIEANDNAGAHAILGNTVIPWFYQSYPQHATDLAGAQAHAQARWFCEEATRRLEANKPGEARDLLLEHVLPWLTSPGPSALGILSVEGLPRKVKEKKATVPKAKKARTAKGKGKKPTPSVLGVEEPPLATAPAPPTAPARDSVRETLLAEAEARQLLPLNRDAALQKQIFADGLVPNSAEFEFRFENVSYVAQRAEHLLTGEVRVYYAPVTNFGDVRYATRDGAPLLNTPFKGGNRITQVFGARPEYYHQFRLAGHEGVDMVPSGRPQDECLWHLCSCL
jgi:hypothetical protein